MALPYLISLRGSVNRKCVEIRGGDGSQCNCTNLMVDHGWTGSPFDGNETHVEIGRNSFRNHPDTVLYPPNFVHSWSAADNVDNLITANGVEGEIDLLSLDIDGVDYWIWNAIE